MASKAEVTPQKEEVPEKEGPETPPDSTLLDLSEAAITKLIRSAKMRGYVTHDQINSLSKGINSEQIEDVLAMFSEMGVNVVETEEAEKGEEQREEADEEPESEGSELVEKPIKAHCAGVSGAARGYVRVLRGNILRRIQRAPTRRLPSGSTGRRLVSCWLLSAVDGFSSCLMSSAKRGGTGSAIASYSALSRRPIESSHVRR
jgi:Sigma-70 factor, region 1.1